MEKQEIAKKMLELTGKKVIERIGGFAQITDLQLTEKPLDKVTEAINHRSEIFIYGTSVTSRLQIFYNVEACYPVLKHLYGEISPEKIFDFFNEGCNLTCGKLKEVLVDQGAVVALSLPIDVESNFEKIKMAYEVLPFYQSWQVTANGQPFFGVKSSLEIHDISVFTGFNFDYQKDEEDGDVDFF